jgi:hypothetical protein
MSAYYDDYQDEPQYSAADEAAFLASENQASDDHYNASADAGIERERQAAVAGRYCLRCGRREGGSTRFTTARQTGICDDCL